MSYTKGITDLSCAILRAVGIDPDTVVGLRYRQDDPRDLPVLQVTTKVWDPDVSEFDVLTRVYELKPIGPDA